MYALGHKRTSHWVHVISASPLKRTSIGEIAMSVLCQQRTRAPQQWTVGASEQFRGNAAHPRSCYALCKSRFFSGSVRMRLPVAAKIALQSAGATSAGGGSPTPPQNPPLGMIMLSTFGASAIRTIG
jgi:hypothetical protein